MFYYGEIEKEVRKIKETMGDNPSFKTLSDYDTFMKSSYQLSS